MKIKLVICDIGGVVCQNSDVIPAIANRFSMLPEEFRCLMAKEIDLLHRGKISATDFWHIFSQKTGYIVGGDPWKEEFHPSVDPQVLKALALIRGKARVVAGTNTIAAHYHILARLGVFAWFDAAYASHELGCVKPEPEFYRTILHKEGAQPEESMFIDDMQSNVDGAKELGLIGILFKGVDGLWQAFRDFNLIGQDEEGPR